MHTNFCFQVCFIVVGVLCLTCDGSIKAGKGKIESFNGNRFTEAKSINNEGLKTIFTATRNRIRPAPPAHDTPASSCSCRKCANWCKCWWWTDMVGKKREAKNRINDIQRKKCQFFFRLIIASRRDDHLLLQAPLIWLMQINFNFFFHQHHKSSMPLSALIAKVFLSIHPIAFSQLL